MPRKPTGSIRRKRRADGSVAFHARFQVRDKDGRNLGEHAQLIGVDLTPQQAEERLAELVADARRGLWTPPVKDTVVAVDGPARRTLAVAVTEWFLLHAGPDGAGGDQYDWATASARDKRWRIDHILSVETRNDRGGLLVQGANIADVPVEDLDVEHVDALKAHLVAYRPTHQADWRLPYKERRRIDSSLSPSTIAKVLTTLSTVCEREIALRHMTRNPVTASRAIEGPKRRQRRRQRVHRLHTFVRPGDLVDLLKAADGLEVSGQSNHQHLGRTVVVGLLFLAGLRCEEIGRLRWRDVDFEAGVMRVGTDDAAGKTLASIRIVHIVDGLRPILEAWAARTRHDRPNDLVAPTRSGKRRDRHNIRSRMLLPVVDAANAMRRARALAAGVPWEEVDQRVEFIRPLAPHDGRRTYCTYVAHVSTRRGEGAEYLMGQVGHTDARLAVEVYNQARNASPLSSEERATIARLMARRDDEDAAAAA